MPRLWDRIRDWVLLFVLLTASLVVLLFQNEALVRGLRGLSLDATSRVEASFSWAGSYFRALEENDVLRQENIRMASQVARSRSAQRENERLRALLGLRDSLEAPVVAARIVAKDITRQQNLITLDVGDEDSVKMDQAVISPQGILGKVVLVSPHYSRVMPYLNTEFRVPARVQELQTDGIVRWDGEQRDRLLMEHVVKTEPVQPGHHVVTSGYSGIFPPGYPIGVVDSVAVRAGRNELLVYLEPSAPLHKVQHAFVLLTQPDPERLALEERRTP